MGAAVDEVSKEHKYLKSGLVNFILPCSVAIFKARGTASSHLDRTHNLSHLERQPIISRPPGGGGFKMKDVVWALT